LLRAVEQGLYCVWPELSGIEGHKPRPGVGASGSRAELNSQVRTLKTEDRRRLQHTPCFPGSTASVGNSQDFSIRRGICHSLNLISWYDFVWAGLSKSLSSIYNHC
jgi:hypothetical protein